MILRIMFRDYFQLVRLDKPIGILLLLWPTLWALLIAGNGSPPLSIVIVFIIGVILTRSAGCAINDYADRDFDGKVKRTCQRPLAKGSINVNSAILICVILSGIAFVMALSFLHTATILMSIPALILYLSYPFMKRFFIFPQSYMAIAYSFGILMGFIELIGKVPLVGYLLFLANCFWSFGYDTIYAMVDKEDDLKIGIYTSAITLGKYDGHGVALCYLLFFSILAIIGILLHMNLFYWLGLLGGAILLLYQIIVIRQKNKDKYFKMFLLNNKVGLLITLGIICNYWFELN